MDRCSEDERDSSIQIKVKVKVKVDRRWMMVSCLVENDCFSAVCGYRNDDKSRDWAWHSPVTCPVRGSFNVRFFRGGLQPQYLTTSLKYITHLADTVVRKTWQQDLCRSEWQNRRRKEQALVSIRRIYTLAYLIFTKLPPISPRSTGTKEETPMEWA